MLFNKEGFLSKKVLPAWTTDAREKKKRQKCSPAKRKKKWKFWERWGPAKQRSRTNRDLIDRQLASARYHFNPSRKQFMERERERCSAERKCQQARRKRKRARMIERRFIYFNGKFFFGKKKVSNEHVLSKRASEHSNKQARKTIWVSLKAIIHSSIIQQMWAKYLTCLTTNGQMRAWVRDCERESEWLRE